MTKYLLTPSLLNSYQYYINDEWKSPADSRADFLKTLSREKFEPNEAMTKGISFENDIFNICNDGFPNLDNQESWDLKHKIAFIVDGGLWQESVKKDIAVGNQEFLLYGRTDVIKRDTIYDIKYTRKYELGKFLDSSQHLIYLYCSGLPKFKYLVSDGKDYWIEDYLNHNGIESEIKSKISDFMGYLDNDKEAKDLFFSKWQSN